VTYRQTTLPACVARFRQIDMHVPHLHHDSLEFADGTIVPLTRLLPGMPLGVPEAADTSDERAPQAHAELTTV
jgi:hypothetical protein